MHKTNLVEVKKIGMVNKDEHRFKDDVVDIVE
jgi:hypothetical protein